MKTIFEKLSIEGKTLRNKLTVIASLLFLLPSFVISYILYNEKISLIAPPYLIMIGFTLVLALSGLIILRKVFDEFFLIAVFMKKAEAGDMYVMEVQKSTAELYDISVAFNSLLKKLEETTRLTEEQTIELKSEVTRRRRAEDGLLLMVKAVENTKTGITFADRDNIIRYTNPADAEMHGYTQEEMTGKGVAIFSPPEIRRPIAFENMKAMKGWARESINIRKDGSVFSVYLISDVVRNEEGEPIGVVTICEDLTDRKRMQRELEDVNAQLFHTSRLSQLGEMALAAARETNILINAISRTNQSIKLDADICQSPSALSKLEEKLKHVDLQVERIKRIIDSLRVFAQREMDSKDFQLTDVSEVVRETLSLVGEQLKLRDIRIDMDFSPDMPKALANRNWLEQVFLNLITNARDAMEAMEVKYSDKEQALTIRGRKSEKGGVVVEVSDTGGGVSKDIKDKIFVPFFTTKEAGMGTGLGLSITQSIIREHGGDITFETREGIGSTFRVILPPV
jgi:PAS domain S-box-containing protein